MSNAFYTVFPLIKKLGVMDVKMLNKDLTDIHDSTFTRDSLIKTLTTSPASQSTAMCFDVQTLWGYQKDDHGNYIRNDKGNKVKQSSSDPPEDHSTLGIIGNQYFGDFLKTMTTPTIGVST